MSKTHIMNKIQVILNSILQIGILQSSIASESALSL